MFLKQANTRYLCWMSYQHNIDVEVLVTQSEHKVFAGDSIRHFGIRSTKRINCAVIATRFLYTLNSACVPSNYWLLSVLRFDTLVRKIVCWCSDSAPNDYELLVWHKVSLCTTELTHSLIRDFNRLKAEMVLTLFFDEMSRWARKTLVVS